MADHDSTNIHAKLRELQEFETFSPFCRVFYDLIDKWIARAQEEKLALASVFVEFLDIELQRHRSIREQSRSGSITIMDLVEISQKLRDDVEHVFSRMKLLEPVSSLSRVVVNLIRAECSYHLGETDQVISSLQNAVSAGCAHPIVFLALGFNLYCRAVKAYTERAEDPEKLVISDPKEFAEECAEAVEAFKRGVRGEESPYDSKLYWWIGSVCEIMHRRTDAIKAYRQAMELDPDTFLSEGTKKIASLSPAAKDAMSESEILRLAELPKITDDDLRHATDWLRGVKGVEDLFRDR